MCSLQMKTNEKMNILFMLILLEIVYRPTVIYASSSVFHIYLSIYLSYSVSFSEQPN